MVQLIVTDQKCFQHITTSQDGGNSSCSQLPAWLWAVVHWGNIFLESQQMNEVIESGRIWNVEAQKRRKCSDDSYVDAMIQ